MHTDQDSAAEIANLFAHLDSPELRIIPGGKDLSPANDTSAQPASVIRYEELKTRDRVQFGRSYPGKVEPGFKAEIIPGVSVRIFGTDYKGAFDLTFKIGDVAVYDSFNNGLHGQDRIDSVQRRSRSAGDGSISALLRRETTITTRTAFLSGTASGWINPRFVEEKSPCRPKK